MTSVVAETLFAAKFNPDTYWAPNYVAPFIIQVGAKRYCDTVP